MSSHAAFQGSQLKFLEEQLEGYAAALIKSRKNDYILDIQCRYFKCFPLSLSHKVEPSQESLDAVDDNAPDPELKAPNPKDISDEEYKTMQGTFEFQCKSLLFQKEVSHVLVHFCIWQFC